MFARQMRRPRLLILTPDFAPAHGGIQLLTHRLATYIEGFDSRVVALGSPAAAEFDRTSPLAIRRAYAGTRLPAARNFALNGIALQEAWRFRPDATLSAHIVTSPAAALIRRALGARTVQYFHAKEVPDKPRLSAFAARRADAVIAVSSYTAGLIAATGTAPADLRLIPPGVDLPSKVGSQERERPTVLTIARLVNRYKGHDVLIEALAHVRSRVPDVRWVVIGDGPLRGELQELARARGLAEGVSFLGAVSDEERERWLERADLLAMPSRLPETGGAGEGFGISYLEAGAHGKPVVAGNVAGALDAVADGETGLLVDPTDARAVAEAIAKLLLDRELATRLGRAGAERARGFAWPLIAGRVEAVLLEQLPQSAGFPSVSREAHEDPARAAG